MGFAALYRSYDTVGHGWGRGGLESNLVMLQGVAAIAVVAEAAAAGEAGGRVLVDGLAETLEAAEELRDLAREVDQDLILGLGRAVAADENRCKLGVGLTDASVGQETVLAEGPEQTIQMLGLPGVGTVDQHARAVRADALDEAAHKEETVAAAVAVQAVEVDSGHGLRRVRLGMRCCRLGSVLPASIIIVADAPEVWI
jgi:hypothetical protein